MGIMRHASLVNSSGFLLDYNEAGAEGRAEYTADVQASYLDNKV